MKIGYLGPEASNTHQAALLLCEKTDILIPLATTYDVFKNVLNGELKSGVVPLENSIEGIVNASVDALIFNEDIHIKKQLILPIWHNLMVKPGHKGNITKIISHPMALAQCSEALNLRYHGIPTATADSTSQSAKIVKDSNENYGAIAHSLAAQLYGLEIIDRNIQDLSDNRTKFVLISPEDTSTPIPKNKLSIAFSTSHKPGELYKILDILSVWDINISSISSRPMKGEIGEYVFLLDLDVGEEIKDITDALTMVKRKTIFYKNLGCYSVINPS